MGGLYGKSRGSSHNVNCSWEKKMEKGKKKKGLGDDEFSWMITCSWLERDGWMPMKLIIDGNSIFI